MVSFLPMHLEGKQPRSEREETDESLRIEREAADHALEDELAAVAETADAVISRARARADSVLAATRAKTDQQSATAASSAQPRKTLERERVLEDQAVREERDNADELLREERAERAHLLSIGRDDTDKDLLYERARSDDLIATRDEFLGTVSHDLRNMLHAMVGSTALIATEVSREDPPRRCSCMLSVFSGRLLG
jgi:signal transduction histidine kinase